MATTLKVWTVGGVSMLHIGDKLIGQSVRIGAIKKICYAPLKGKFGCKIILDDETIDIDSEYEHVIAALSGQ